MVSSVIEQLMQTPIVQLPPSLVTHAEERRDQYDQFDH